MTQSYRAARAFRKRGFVSLLSDIIWSPRSLLSENLVDRPGVIEPQLWGELHFLGAPLCSRCGFPLPQEVGETAVCGACAGCERAYDTARAALAYDDHARRLILDLKRGGRRDGLPVFARWMATAAGPALDRADFLAPAPMHWTRLAVRSFNQAPWLPQALSRASGKACKPGALTRAKRRKTRRGSLPWSAAVTSPAPSRRPGASRAKRSLWLTMCSPQGPRSKPAPVHFAKRGLQKCMQSPSRALLGQWISFRESLSRICRR